MGVYYHNGYFWGSTFVDGKRRRKCLKEAINKKEADLAYLKWISNINPTVKSNTLFEEFFLKWEREKAPQFAPETRRAYNRMKEVVLEVKPNLRLKDINIPFLDKCKSYWLEKYPLPSVHNFIKNLKAIHRVAVMWEMAPRIEWQEYKNVKVIKKRGNEPFWEEEIEIILESARNQKSPTNLTVTMLGLYAGMRIAEKSYLDWANIDFTRNIIKIRAKDGWYPKGKKERNIALHPTLKNYLLSLREKTTSPHVIFERRSGSRISPQVLDAQYNTFLQEECGLEEGTDHKLRHTFITFCMSNGVDIKTIMSWSGHSSLKVLLEYLHWVKGNNKKISQLTYNTTDSN